MPKPLTFRDELSRLIDKHWKRFELLVSKAKKYKDAGDTEKEDEVYLLMREKIYDLDPIEAHILKLNPKLKESWFALKHTKTKKEQ